jgi:undecaprenyl-diphosphatase
VGAAADDDGAVVSSDGGRGSGTVVAVGVAAVVLAVTAAVAATTPVSTFELDVFAALNGAPAVLAWLVWVVMQAGSVGGGLAVALVVFGMLRDARGAVLGVAAVLIAWLSARALKAVVARGRPADVLDAVDTLFEPVLRSDGFPSGHSAVAFALATVVAPSLAGRWRVVPFVLAAVVGLGRLVFGAHLPLDVVGGAALGVVVGGLLLLGTGRTNGPTGPPRDAARGRPPGASGTAPGA